LRFYYFLFFLIFFCSTHCKHPVKKLLPNKYSSLFKTHPAGDITQYSLSENWEDRVYQLDEVHKDFAHRMNLLDDYSQVPTPYPDFARIKTLVREIASEESQEIKKLRTKYIYGIYICKNLGGTGISGFVYDKDNIPGGFILIDGDMISRNANDWISLKESSVFQTQDSSKLRVLISEEENSKISGALDYILLHELGHIISQTEKILPDQRDEYRDFTKFSFSSKDWINEETSVYDENLFPERSKLFFYSKTSKLTIPNDAEKIYQNLEKTSFPTLYSSQNPDDHFADSFVSYITTILHKKDHIIKISYPDGTYKIFRNGMLTGRSKREVSFFTSLF
jgi:hypothetical protein